MTEKITILLVDDEIDFLASFSNILQANKYKVIKARNGQEAIKKLHQHIPHLILLDVMMPVMNGYEVAQRIREDVRIKHLPIIMLTARGNLEDEIACLSLGVDDYLAKPFVIEEVVAKIKTIIERTYRGLDANPLTRLPGNNAIRERINQTIISKQPYAIGYLDLDNFKSYNDHYGFKKGDQAILQTSNIIIKTMHRLGRKEDFIGHIGGDDFIFITHPNLVEAICQHILVSFARIVPSLYDQEDLKRGYIVSINRHGKEEETPLMTLSIGVVTNRFRQFDHLAEISQIATEVKEYAKRLDGNSYCIDRRRKKNKVVIKSSIKKKRILIVDDEPNINDLLSMLLSKAGYEVDQAHNGSCALKMIKEHFYHLVILDLKLPDINGLDLLTEIKAEHKLTVVIIITGDVSVNQVLTALRRQAFDFLIKPVVIDKLLLTIRQGLKQQEEWLHHQEISSSLQKRVTELEANLTVDI